MKITAGHIVLLLLLIGAGQLAVGIYLLAGVGWAVVGMGLATVGMAFILSRGLTNA